MLWMSVHMAHCILYPFIFLELKAALDGHFGIWTVSSLDMDQKGL